LPGGDHRRRAIRANNKQPSRPFDRPTDRRPSPATVRVKPAEMTVDCTDLVAI
jgi:hypothetical protein